MPNINILLISNSILISFIHHYDGVAVFPAASVRISGSVTSALQPIC